MEVWIILNTWRDKEEPHSAVYLYSTKEEATKWFNHYVSITKQRNEEQITNKNYSCDEIGDYLFCIHDDKNDYYEEFYMTDRIIDND